MRLEQRNAIHEGGIAGGHNQQATDHHPPSVEKTTCRTGAGESLPGRRGASFDFVSHAPSLSQHVKMTDQLDVEPDAALVRVYVEVLVLTMNAHALIATE